MYIEIDFDAIYLYSISRRVPVLIGLHKHSKKKNIDRKMLMFNIAMDE